MESNRSLRQQRCQSELETRPWWGDLPCDALRTPADPGTAHITQHQQCAAATSSGPQRDRGRGKESVKVCAGIGFTELCKSSLQGPGGI